MNDNAIKKDRDTKKITTLVILIVTLLVCETGATYAYFAFSASSNNTASGTAATASIAFKNSGTSCAAGTAEDATPSLFAPTNATYISNNMVPQKSLVGTTNVLQKAFNGASGKDKCVDANNNVICKAYTFTIKNCSTATAVLKGQIQFTWGSSDAFGNLKWKLMTNAGTVAVSSSDGGTVAAKNTWQNFATSVSLAPNAVKQYWLIVWIEETGSSQNTTDKGTWQASFQFVNNVDNSGITSTITS